MFPPLFETRMREILGSDFDAFAASYDRPRNVGLRLNPLKTDAVPPLPFALSPVPWEKNGYYYDPKDRPGLHPYHEAGLYYLQEPSAMAPAALSGAGPDMRVLDLCAAPGGKTTQLAAAMKGTGLLVCNEINEKRARILSQNVERMGIRNALVLNERPEVLAGRFPGFFDRVLVDAPCSGEGMFRKEDAAVTDWSPETVQMCARRQLEILTSAARMVAPGGRLIYSTCTFSPEENEGVISAFLNSNPAFSIFPVSAPWFAPGRPDLCENPAPGLSNAVRLFPHLLRGEGHFAAVLQYNGVPEPVFQEPAPLQSVPDAAAAFLRDAGISLGAEGVLLFGDTVYAPPAELPCLSGLRVLRPGLQLGTLKKDRFEPAHALALSLRTFPQTADFPADSAEIRRYLRGETLSGSQAGWTLVTVDGLSLGWAKGSGGQLKNHYPKGLRRP